MKKIVPFKKDLDFKTNIAEITSISLEHSLHLNDSSLITGSFLLSGEYKIADSSTNTEKFSFDLPFDITIDDKYKVDNINIDIDDFYYEIVNNKVLSINIDVLIDKLEEKVLEIEKKDQPNVEVVEQKEITLDDLLDERCYEEEVPFKQIEKIEAVSDDKTNDNSKTIFDGFDNGVDNFATYKVCIVRENDSIDSILQKYSITKEELEIYNNINELKIGDKLIIPSLNNEKV